ncbi:transglutaminase-like cysteine peptidase [Halopseudomonas oceani]|uniref:transglutaminase-like cysteine peptidase n=1 Tax=Halopseudomonas oceani TaxID=1708783 RepID=UPI003898EA0B
MNISLRSWSLLPACLLLVALSAIGWDYEHIFARINTLYNPDMQAQWRLQEWRTLLDDSQTLNDQQKLEAVNDFFNQRLRFSDDISIWGEVDYWASPAESMVKGAADCEDYSIAKYFSLRRAGIPNDQLRLTYVKALELNQAHMVLTYYATPDSEPLVLDNLTDRILPASHRNDLLPVYSFNAEGLWLAGRGNSQTGSAKQLSRWQDLLKKMQNEGFDDLALP